MILVAQNVLDDLEQRTARFETSEAARAARGLPGYDAHRSKMDCRTRAATSNRTTSTPGSNPGGRFDNRR